MASLLSNNNLTPQQMSDMVSTEFGKAYMTLVEKEIPPIVVGNALFSAGYAVLLEQGLSPEQVAVMFAEIQKAIVPIKATPA